MQTDRVQKPDIVDALISDWARERSDLDVRAMNVVGRVIRAGRAMEDEASRVLKRFGLDYAAFDVLATLRRTGEPFELTPGDLRKSVLLSSGAMTACLDRLERDDLIERRRDPNDRRSSSARLTSAGIQMIDKAFPARLACAEHGIAALGDHERAVLADLLRKI